jgi:hypothetical protein
MKAWRQRLVGAILLILFTAGPSVLAAPDLLNWNQRQGRVDADISSWDTLQLLEHVAAATGWQVYLDPGAVHNISAKFKDLPTGEALHNLLGNVNFVVLPQTNGASQLYVFRTTRQQATRQIRAPARKAQPIPNQLIVTLKPNSKTKIEDLAKLLGAKVIGRMDKQNAYLLQFDNEAATQAVREQLAANPEVQSVDVNYPVDRPPQMQVAASGSPELDLKPKANDGNCNLVVGLIDTPLQPLATNLSQFIQPAIHVAGDVQLDPGQLTHGTAMAETILDAINAKTGGSTSVKILPVDVYGNNEMTSTFDVANGIVQAVNNGANIINLSLGSTGDSTFLHNTIKAVAKQGIPLYAAAGNEPVTTPTYPAAYPEVVSVTASDRSGQIAPYANRGSFIDMMVNGDNVVGYNGLSYLVQGTSTSTAFASGMAAGLADSAHACADQAQSLLQKSLKPANILK